MGLVQQLPKYIHTPNFEFFSKQYFALELDMTTSTPTATGPDASNTDFLGRQVFSKMGAMEMKREIRKHRESGSRIPWIGGNTEEISAIVFERGFSYDPQLYPGGDANSGIDLAVVSATRYHLYYWYRKGYKVDCILYIYNDYEGALYQMRDPVSKWALRGCKPTRYKGFEGDASSSDTSLEEIEIELEDIEPLSDT